MLHMRVHNTISAIGSFDLLGTLLCYNLCLLTVKDSVERNKVNL